MGNVKARLGDQEASVPVVASVAPREPGRTKVLVISSNFGTYSDRPDYYRPWFDLVREAKLDVSYMHSRSVPVSKAPPVPGSVWAAGGTEPIRRRSSWPTGGSWISM